MVLRVRAEYQLLRLLLYCPDVLQTLRLGRTDEVIVVAGAAVQVLYGLVLLFRLACIRLIEQVLKIAFSWDR